MIAVTVTFELHQGQEAAFLPLVQANARTSLEDEPGCRQFDVCHDAARPGEVFLYELYDSRAAFDDHLATAHFKAFDAQVADMVADKTVRIFGEVVQ
ncbi:putative quinol monooxygenase [Pacificoceanicola onchidii]|uniref:putative quinol monooxygenase n=1 Tax=Pacificoceanicola onchidii TaxID=2562685 RepID=UPI0010A47C04|nr:putative quinol monooxygenase [Pacificoceanicola onchidii]